MVRPRSGSASVLPSRAESRALIAEAVKLPRPGAVKLFRTTVIRHDGREVKHLSELTNELPRKSFAFVDQENAPAEPIQPLEVRLAANGIEGPPSGLSGKMAGDNGSSKEAEKRYPLRIGDRHVADRGQEKEIEGEGGSKWRRPALRKTPTPWRSPAPAAVRGNPQSSRSPARRERRPT